MTTDSRRREAILAAVDDYGDIPRQMSSFRQLIADAVEAGLDHRPPPEPPPSPHPGIGVLDDCGWCRGYTAAMRDNVSALEEARHYDAASVLNEAFEVIRGMP